MEVDKPGLTDISWTVNGNSPLCETSMSSDCSSDNVIFLPITGNEGDTINVKLIAVRYEKVYSRNTDIGGDVFEFWKFIGTKVGAYNLEFVEKRPAAYLPEKGRYKFDLKIY